MTVLPPAGNTVFWAHYVLVSAPFLQSRCDCLELRGKRTEHEQLRANPDRNGRNGLLNQAWGRAMTD